MEKGTSQFFRSAGRCGAMRRGVHAGMPLGTLPCPTPASLGQITSFSKKPSFFGKSLEICGQGSKGQGSSPPKACSQGQGMQPPHGHAAKAMARSQGMLPRPRHAAKALQQRRPMHAAKAKPPMGMQPRQPPMGMPNRLLETSSKIMD